MKAGERNLEKAVAGKSRDPMASRSQRDGIANAGWSKRKNQGRLQGREEC